jgi:hypothetical protein
MIKTTVSVIEYKELEKEIIELEDELFNTLHDLVTITLKFNKLAALCPHVNPDDIIVDEGEVMEEFRKLDLAV